MRNSLVTALIFGVVVCAGCKQPGPDLALGPPTTFRLALFHDHFDIGIDLEIRVPAGYASFGSSPFSRSWDRRRAIGIDVTTHPERQATFDEPCGKPQPQHGWSNRIAARTGSPGDMSVVCESRIGNEISGEHVVRLVTSIDTVIQCHAYANARPLSADEKAAALAICGSLRVLGRSTWTRADYLEKDTKP